MKTYPDDANGEPIPVGTPEQEADITQDVTDSIDEHREDVDD